MRELPQLERIWAQAQAVPARWYVIGAGALALAWWLRRAWRRYQRGALARQLRQRQRCAKRAEADAAGVLRAHGYQVLSDQFKHHWTIQVDGHPHQVELRADYLVARGRQRFIAEVKTGMSAPSVATASTRRQLLEYRVAYPVDGILLVDMEEVVIRRVDFGDDVEQRHGTRGWIWFVLGAGAGGALAWAALIGWGGG